MPVTAHSMRGELYHDPDADHEIDPLEAADVQARLPADLPPLPLDLRAPAYDAARARLTADDLEILR